MSAHAPHTIERHCDVAVVGGSAAGLAAADQRGRHRRSGMVVDARITDASTEGIREFNRRLFARRDFESVIVPLRDGVAIARKLERQ